jgi:hypothetical protein
MLKKQTFISSLSLFLVLFFAYAEKAISYHQTPGIPAGPIDLTCSAYNCLNGSTPTRCRAAVIAALLTRATDRRRVGLHHRQAPSHTAECQGFIRKTLASCFGVNLTK